MRDLRQNIPKGAERPKRTKLEEARRHLATYIGLTPFFGLMAAFMLAPMVHGLVMSFTDWSISSRDSINFVGLENYVYILNGESLGSQRYYRSLLNLAIYVPITITVGLAVALVLALIVSSLPHKVYTWYRAAFFVPTVLPLFLAAGIWQWLMNSDTGLVASALASIGIGANVNWLTTAGWAIAVVIFVDVWRSVGFNFIIFSTGIQDVSPELYDAADIDGAGVVQKMRHITIPMIEPIIFFVVTYSFISALQVYDVPQILTQGQDPNSTGGPGQVMLFPVMEMVRNVRIGGDSGLARAAAEGTVLMIIIMMVTLVIFRLRRKKV